MKHGLTGYIPVRNGLSLDYCWIEAARSLLPVVDELILCDSDSTDGTREAIEALSVVEGKIRVMNRPWPDPHKDGQFLPKWLNFIRESAQFDMQITLDADELIGVESHALIRAAVEVGGCRYFDRWNFWRDAQHTIPRGYICGWRVARLAPTALWMVSDEPDPRDMEVHSRAKWVEGLNVYHYGFLRRPAAFFAKSKVMHEAVLGTYDPRLTEAEATGAPWWSLIHGDLKLDEFKGEHPAAIHEWLRARGYEP